MAKMKVPGVCTPRLLPEDQWVEAANTAIRENPANRPALEMLRMALPDFEPTPQHIAVATTKYWGLGGVRLTVGFLDNPPSDLRQRIVSHMNAWNKLANVEFTETSQASTADVRIARESSGPDQGYWSNLGTDIRLVPRHRQTMNLDSFTMNTPESEFVRVVRHEAGHTLGFVHEHMRAEIVERIDPGKAYAYFLRTQGWNKQMVDQQVLTPLNESSLLGTDTADEDSIMCYQLPGQITTDGEPILGGTDITDRDHAFVGLIYPKDELPSAAPMAAVGGPERAGAPVGRGGLEEMIEAASRAALRALEAHRAGGNAKTTRARLFFGLMASEE